MNPLTPWLSTLTPPPPHPHAHDTYSESGYLMGPEQLFGLIGVPAITYYVSTQLGEEQVGRVRRWYVVFVS